MHAPDASQLEERQSVEGMEPVVKDRPSLEATSGGARARRVPHTAKVACRGPRDQL